MRLDAVADALGAELCGPAEREVAAVASLASAGPRELAAVFERRGWSDARSTRAGALIVGPSTAPDLPSACARLVVDDPRAAFGRALRLLHPTPVIARPAGCHPTAVIDSTASLAAGVGVGALAVIGAGADIGPGATIGAGCVVGAQVRIGARTHLLPRAVVLDGCELGADVTVASGAVIGAPGFGLDAAGRVPHIGRVVVGDGATIGANTCIDRATVGITRVGARAHLDNLVQVGHNAQIGPGAVLCGQVGVAGGAVIEAGAVIGGQAGIAGHRTVGAGAQVAAQSGVTRDLAAGGRYSGHPAEPNRQRLQRLARLRRLLRR